MPRGPAGKAVHQLDVHPVYEQASPPPASPAGWRVRSAATAAPTTPTPRRRAEASGRRGSRSTPATSPRRWPRETGSADAPAQPPTSDQREAGGGNDACRSRHVDHPADRAPSMASPSTRSGEHEPGPGEERERALPRGRADVPLESGPAAIASSGVVANPRRDPSSSTVAVVSRLARARRVEPPPQSAAVHAMAGPMMFRMSTFNSCRGAWRIRRARTTAAGRETRSRKICQPRRSTRARRASPAAAPAPNLRRR